MPIANHYIVIRTEHWTDWYTQDGDGGWRQTKTTNRWFSEEVIWSQDDYYLYDFWDRSGNVDRTGGGGEGRYGSTYTGIAAREEAKIKKIDDRHSYEIINELIGKEKCLNKLLTERGTDFVENLLKNFVGKSKFDIKINSKDKIVSQKTGNEINGETWPPVNKIININVSTSMTNKHSALEGAKTILHEYMLIFTEN